jgi:hypothetical protein
VRLEQSLPVVEIEDSTQGWAAIMAKALVTENCPIWFNLKMLLRKMQWIGILGLTLFSHAILIIIGRARRLYTQTIMPGTFKSQTLQRSITFFLTLVLLHYRAY